MIIVAGNSSYRTNQNAVSGGTVTIASQLNLGPTASVVELTNNIVSSPGTYTIFQTGNGIFWNNSQLTAGSSLIGKLSFILPNGFAVQAVFVDSTGLNVKLVVRQAIVSS